MTDTEQKRWHIEFRYASGQELPPMDIEELEELQDIVEGGPDFGTLIDIVITYNFKQAAEERGKVARLS